MARNSHMLMQIEHDFIQVLSRHGHCQATQVCRTPRMDLQPMDSRDTFHNRPAKAAAVFVVAGNPKEALAQALQASFCQAGTICDPKGPNPVPQRVTGVTAAAHLAAGGHHTCVVLTSGAGRCWGLGDQGQLGNGAKLRSSTPVGVSGLSGATHASAGSAFSCASAAGALRCWGANGAGELGNSSRTDASTPAAVTAIAAGSYDPQTLRSGDGSTCLVRLDGTGSCFP